MKTYVISSDIRRALSTPGFIVSMIGVVLVIALASADSVIEAVRSGAPLANGYHAQIIIDAFSSDGFTLALPILCALPYTAAFVDDMKSGYIKLYLHRSGAKSYVKGKIVACAFSGGLALLLGILLAYALSALVFTPMELALGEEEATQPYPAQLLLKSATLFFSGAFWSLTGGTFAAATRSKYMAYASPFIFYYVLIILHERYFEDLYVVYPREWLLQSEPWPLGGFGVMLLLALLSAIVSLCFAIIAGRRLENA